MLCFCKRNDLNPQHARYVHNGTPACSDNCFQRALRSHQQQEAQRDMDKRLRDAESIAHEQRVIRARRASAVGSWNGA